MINITTWNINSVNARLDLLLAYLNEAKPDVLCLQEIKTPNDNFPFLEIKSAGYNAVVAGQKSYNGVAMLSKEPLTKVEYELPLAPFSEPAQARFIAGETPSGLRIISVYVPNGNPPLKEPDSKEKLIFKLKWLDALIAYAQKMITEEVPFVLAGDFNIIMEDGDVYAPESYRNNALMVPEVQEKMERLVQSGLTNAFKTLHGGSGNYSFWDYTMGAWQRNLGMLIDHILLSPLVAPKLTDAWTDKEMRGREKPSDHVPLCCELAL